MYDVITLGSATVDVFASTNSQLVKVITNSSEKDLIAYPSGSKILVRSIDFMIGGGGTNTAVSFSRLGFKTAFLGKIGADENGDKVIDVLRKEMVDFVGVRGGQTGFSIVLDSLEKDRTILAFKGANDDLAVDDLYNASLDCSWLYCSSMTGNSFETLKQLVSNARKNDVNVAFNPSNYQAKLGMESLKPILNNCTVLIVNHEEAILLVGKEEPVSVLAQTLSKQGPEYVVITDGDKGATCFVDNKLYRILPSPEVKVVETTGAGDAFASGFLAGLMSKLAVKESLILGMSQAESVIGANGAKTNLLNKDEALKRVKQFKGSVKQQLVHSFTSQPELKPNTYRTSPENYFKLDDGHIIESIEELGYYLKFMPQKIFDIHTQEENHFSLWIKNVFNLEKLAQQISTASKNDTSKILLNFVHR